MVLQPSTPAGWPPTGGSIAFDIGSHPQAWARARLSVQRSGAVGRATTMAPNERMKRCMVPGKARVVRTRQGRPARAAYAAAAAPALPDEETAIPARPLARAQATATEASRSLNDQVGFWASFLAMSPGSPISS